MRMFVLLKLSCSLHVIMFSVSFKDPGYTAMSRYVIAILWNLHPEQELLMHRFIYSVKGGEKWLFS